MNAVYQVPGAGRKFQRLALFVLTIVICWQPSLGFRKPTGLAKGSDCVYSDQIYNSDGALVSLREAPTHFRLMSGRYVAMLQAARGYQCAGSVAVGFDGHRYFQTGRGDDPGISELIPTVSQQMGLSIASAYDITIAFTLAAGLLIGYAGFCKLYPERRLRWMGAGVYLCLGFAEGRVADAYIFQISPMIAGIPWLIYFALDRKHRALTLCAVLLALICSWCSLVRAGTLLICMTFLMTMLIFRMRIQKPLVPCLLIVLAVVPSLIFQRSVITRRDATLSRLGQSAIAQNGHLLWHTIYLGLGFIHNSEVPEYLDVVAVNKALSIDPNVVVTSARYEAILRHEIWSIIKRKPMLVMGIIASKVAIVVLLGIILLYPSRRYFFIEGPLIWLDTALLATMAVSAMNAIVAVPRASYLLSFLCLGSLCSTIKLFRAQGQSGPRMLSLL